MSSEDLSWMAGIVESRGHVEINDRHGTPQARVRITTARVALLEEFARLAGTKVVMGARTYQRRACSEHCEEPHQHIAWQSASVTIDSARAYIVLRAIEPYLKASSDKIKLALVAGAQAWPPKRGNTLAQMKKLGWPEPGR